MPPRSLDLAPIGYITFRLAPFILVSFFVISSIFRQDIKGLIYLMGLVLACFCTALFGNLFPMNITKSDIDIRKCNVFTLTKAGPLSKIPLSQTVFGYTFAYLLYVIITYNLAIQTMPTLILLPVLILADFVWNAHNDCAGVFPMTVALIVGCLVGWFWSYVIDSTKLVKLQYFDGLGSTQMCARPANPKFKINSVGTLDTSTKNPWANDLQPVPDADVLKDLHM